MKTQHVVAAGLALASSAMAQAQQVDLRIIERTGQTTASTADNVLDFAIQARVTGGPMLAGVGFDVHMLGEVESAGTLVRAKTSNADGTYSSDFAANSTVGVGGLAAQYTYLAGLQPAFNGMINASNATFTNGPDQEIGLITSYTANGPLLGTPGMDTDEDGNPDTWSGNGTGAAPNGAVAMVPAALRGPYFAQSQFIDIYRFRYTVNNLAARPLTITLETLVGSTFQTLWVNGNIWLPQNSVTVPASSFSVVNWTGSVVPSAPACAPCAIALLGLRRTRRRQA